MHNIYPLYCKEITVCVGKGMSKVDSSASNGDHVENTTASVNYLPCSIQYDGPASASTYFLIKEKTDSTLEAYFRGRKLMGKEFSFPENICAAHAVLQKEGNPNSIRCKVMDEIPKMNIWEHNKLPSVCEIEETLDWIEVAAAVSLLY
jgi:hypothetical protein